MYVANSEGYNGSGLFHALRDYFTRLCPSSAKRFDGPRKFVDTKNVSTHLWDLYNTIPWFSLYVFRNLFQGHWLHRLRQYAWFCANIELKLALLPGCICTSSLTVLTSCSLPSWKEPVPCMPCYVRTPTSARACHIKTSGQRSNSLLMS